MSETTENQNNDSLDVDEKPIEEALNDTLSVYNFFNQRLKRIAEQLKEIQPNKEGSITLYLSNCGIGCLGCPHPKWLKWGVNKEGKYSGFAIKNPAMSIAKQNKSDFKDCNQQRPELIKEAIFIIKERSEMVHELSALNRVCKRAFKKYNS